MFGLVVLGLALTAFLAPPFSGLDTLPSLGVVVLALGYLLADIVLASVGAGDRSARRRLGDLPREHRRQSRQEHLLMLEKGLVG